MNRFAEFYNQKIRAPVLYAEYKKLLNILEDVQEGETSGLMGGLSEEEFNNLQSRIFCLADKLEWCGFNDEKAILMEVYQNAD